MHPRVDFSCLIQAMFSSASTSSYRLGLAQDLDLVHSGAIFGK